MSDITASNKFFDYNKSTRRYTFHTRKRYGRDIVIEKEKMDEIIKLYSDFTGGITAREIGLKIGHPMVAVRHMLRVMGITHGSIPFSDETVAAVDEETLVSDALEKKRTSITLKIERRDLEDVRRDADSWRYMQMMQVNPFKEILDGWKAPTWKPIPSPKSFGPVSGRTLLVGMSDWHYGLVAHERHLYTQREWNIEETKRSVRDYALQLKRHLLSVSGNYDEVRLLMMGDMAHTLSGYTDKGTKLEAHPIAEEQLMTAVESMTSFIKEVLSVSRKVVVHACSGNHSALGDYMIAMILSKCFKDEPRIKFEITSARHLTFNIYRNLFLMEHGYSSVTKDRLPPCGPRRENYINNLFLAKPELLTNIDNRYYLSADQHHFESYELTGVEGYMFPTLVGGCRYADNSGYISRPRQTCLVVDATGVGSVMHFFFDKSTPAGGMFTPDLFE